MLTLLQRVGDAPTFTLPDSELPVEIILPAGLVQRLQYAGAPVSLLRADDLTRLAAIARRYAHLRALARDDQIALLQGLPADEDALDAALDAPSKEPVQ